MSRATILESLVFDLRNDLDRLRRRRTILDSLFFDLQQDVDRIRRRFNYPSSVRITLVVRVADLDDAHAVISDDDLNAAIATIQRHKYLPPQFTPTP